MGEVERSSGSNIIFPTVTKLIKIFLNMENGSYQVSIIPRFHWIHLKEQLTYYFK